MPREESLYAGDWLRLAERDWEQVGVVSLLATTVLNEDNVHPTLPQCLDQAEHHMFVRVPFQHRSDLGRTNVMD
jgi:hypothetical protein